MKDHVQELCRILSTLKGSPEDVIQRLDDEWLKELGIDNGRSIPSSLGRERSRL